MKHLCLFVWSIFNFAVAFLLVHFPSSKGKKPLLSLVFFIWRKWKLVCFSYLHWLDFLYPILISIHIYYYLEFWKMFLIFFSFSFYGVKFVNSSRSKQQFLGNLYLVKNVTYSSFITYSYLHKVFFSLLVSHDG